MVLVGCAILPHAPITLDPSLAEGQVTRELHEACQDVAQSIRDRQPHLIVLTTPHGICSSRNTASVYLNSKATGSCDWKGRWSEYTVEANLDRKSAQHLLKHLQSRSCLCDGVEVGGQDTVAPLCWAEAVPLYFIRDVLVMAKLVVIAHGFPGAKDSSGEARGVSSGSIVTISNSLNLGQGISDWVDSPVNSQRRIFVLVSCGLSQTHLGIGCCPCTYTPHRTADPAFLNEMGVEFGDKETHGSRAAWEFDQCVEEWIQTFRPEPLMLRARKFTQAVMPCGFEGCCCLHGVMDGRSSEVWERHLWPIFVPTNQSLLCAMFLPNWEMLPEDVTVLNQGEVRVRAPQNTTELVVSFSRFARVKDVRGGCIRVPTSELHLEIARLDKVKRRADRVAARRERAERGEESGDETDSSSDENEGFFREEGEGSQLASGFFNSGAFNSSVASNIQSQALGSMKSIQGLVAGGDGTAGEAIIPHNASKLSSATSPKRDGVGAAFLSKAFGVFRRRKKREVAPPRFEASGKVLWVVVENHEKPKDVAEHAIRMGAIAVVVECPAADWEATEYMSTSELLSVPVVWVRSDDGDEASREGSSGYTKRVGMPGSFDIDIAFFMEMQEMNTTWGTAVSLVKFKPEASMDSEELSGGAPLTVPQRSNSLHRTSELTKMLAGQMAVADADDGAALVPVIQEEVASNDEYQRLRVEFDDMKRALDEAQERNASLLGELEAVRNLQPSLKALSDTLMTVCMRPVSGSERDAAMLEKRRQAGAVVVAFACRPLHGYKPYSDDFDEECSWLSACVLQAYAQRKIVRMRYLVQVARYRRFSGGISVGAGMSSKRPDGRPPFGPISTLHQSALIVPVALSIETPRTPRAPLGVMSSSYHSSSSAPRITLDTLSLDPGSPAKPKKAFRLTPRLIMSEMPLPRERNNLLMPSLPMREGMRGVMDTRTLDTLGTLGSSGKLQTSVTMMKLGGGLGPSEVLRTMQ